MKTLQRDTTEGSGEWLAALLRLAVLFNRSRTDVVIANIDCRAKGRHLSIGLSEAWLDCNPLTGADLKREKKYLAGAGIEMSIGPADGGD